jgi:hypothetical protein
VARLDSAQVWAARAAVWTKVEIDRRLGAAWVRIESMPPADASLRRTIATQG